MQGPVIVTTGHGERQVARVQPARARHARARPARPRALPLPDEGARPGPGAQAARAARAVPAPRDLRRRHAEGGAPRDPGRSNLILTNPDMLNVGVLPHHRNWGDVLANLAWVVVDEAHVYRGVFGSHVGERAAAAAPARARLRHRAALRADERDDREPARAGRAADRARPRASWTATARRTRSARS